MLASRPVCPPQPTWVSTLRDALRHDHGRGWIVTESHGRVRLTRRDHANVRSSITLPIAWVRGCLSTVIAAVAGLRERMEERGLSLSAAAELLAVAPPTGPINWENLVALHLEGRIDLRSTTLGDLTTRLKRLLATLSSRPTPRDGPELLRAFARQHFANCPAGGQGRRRQIGDCARFLRWAVERRGIPICWTPPPASHLAELIGVSDTPATATVPISPEALAGLLDHLEANRPELWLAVALVGSYGLRPAELGVLHPKGGLLYVGCVKRNSSSGIGQDRLALPLELPGRNDGARALKLLEAELLQVPLPIRTAMATGQHKQVGDAFRQLLGMMSYWASLVARTPGLTPYGLRHGFAWRGAHRQPPIPLRDLAAVMGHTPATHLKHYGRWTAEADLIASFATTPAVVIDATQPHR
jgi:hypothetical protein